MASLNKANRLRDPLNPKAELHSFIEQDLKLNERLFAQIDAADESLLRYVLAVKESPEAALAWLTLPTPFLQNQAPLELSTTPAGVVKVLEFLVRAEYNLLPKKEGSAGTSPRVGTATSGISAPD